MHKLISVALLGLLYLAKAMTAEAQVPQHVVNVPGTGVRMVLPPGVFAGPLGTFFIDSAGDVYIHVTIGPARFSEGANAVYPDPPQPFQSQYLSGTLSGLDRSRDHSTWDGLLLRVKRENVALGVQITYKGQDPGRWQELKAILSEIQWDEHQLDAERAFGAHFSVPGLRLVPDAIGMLSYTESGQAGGSGLSLFVSTVPLVQVKPEALTSGCHGFSRVFHSPYVGPNFLQQNGMTACDAWLVDQGNRGTGGTI
jgi:hypothetical protein